MDRGIPGKEAGKQVDVNNFIPDPEDDAREDDDAFTHTARTGKKHFDNPNACPIELNPDNVGFGPRIDMPGDRPVEREVFGEDED